MRKNLQTVLAALLAMTLPLPLYGQPAAKPPALPPIAPNLARLSQTLGGLDSAGTAVAARDAAGILAAACEDGSIHFWHKGVLLGVRTGEATPDVIHAHEGQVLSLAWTAGNTLASGGVDGKIVLSSLPDGKPVQQLAAGGVVRALAASPDGKWLASGGSDDGSVQLWDAATGKPRLKLAGHTDWVLCVAFSPDGKQLLSGGYDGVVRLWDVASGKKLRDVASQPPAAPNTPPAAPNFVNAVAFSPDSTLIALAGTDTQVHLVNVANGKLVRSCPGHTGSVTSLAFHASGTVLASSSKDRTVRLWNPANAQLLKLLEGHTAWVQGISFYAQGTRLASVGADGTVRLWDLTDPAKK